jgi:hypothetical protein
MSDTTVVPAGYLEDAKGRLWPEKMVSTFDKERDCLVKELLGLAKSLNSEIVKTKHRVFDDVHAFVELSAERYGAKIGGIKGNLTLQSFDGRYRIQVATSERIKFDEGLQAAKALIDECVDDWGTSCPPEAKVVMGGAFETDKEGNLSTARVLGLLRWSINDPRWLSAMKAITESVTVVGSKQYVRFYERVGRTGRYEAVSLDIAAA